MSTEEGGSISENTGFYAQAGWLGFYYNYPRPMAQAVRSYADEAVIQEIRLVTDDGGNFDYVVGGFYRSQQREMTQQSYLVGFKDWWDTLLPFELFVACPKDHVAFYHIGTMGEYLDHLCNNMGELGFDAHFAMSSGLRTFQDVVTDAGTHWRSLKLSPSMC